MNAYKIDRTQVQVARTLPERLRKASSSRGNVERVASSHYLLRKRTTWKHVWKQIIPDTGNRIVVKVYEQSHTVSVHSVP
jgi:hypothetical protein